MSSSALLLILLLRPACQARPPPTNVQDAPSTEEKQPKLIELSIEDLMKIEVTSASRKSERLVDTPSAVFVIRQEDIQRSGVRSIPEALRMAPGIEVTRINANKWAVTIRGFGDLFSNKLLVLVDGRSVYNPTFSGVNWDVQDLVMEDIDRIEVIRGPGATVWGANAVNGVINIITKKAKDTQGGMVAVGGGTQERGFGAARYGGKIGENAYFRVFAKYSDHVDSDGGNDAWQLAHAGFRTDWTPTKADFLTLQGDYFRGIMGSRNSAATLQPPFSVDVRSSSQVSGGNVLSRWEHTFGEKNILTAQFYYDRSDRNEPWFGELRDTLDFDVHDRFPLFEGHDITWGLGYRWTRGDFGSTFTAQMPAEVKVDEIASAFVQDEIEIVPRSLHLTLGAKFEYNNYTHFEFQPNARLLWNVTEEQVFWASASRAVRTPSPSDTQVRFNQAVLPPPGPGLPPTLISVFGDRGFKSEQLTAYELGYRVMPAARLSLDAAAFYNIYKKLRSVEPGTPTFEPAPAPAHALVPLSLENEMGGRTYGLELAALWQVMDGWRLQGSYTFYKMSLIPERGSLDTTSASSEKADPANQVYVHSALDLSKTLHFDATARYVDILSSRHIPSYFEAEARLAWDVNDSLEISIVGQNLVHRRHFESNNAPLNIQVTPVERGAYASILWRF
jgi:iron complex outermembrane receptor protein